MSRRGRHRRVVAPPTRLGASEEGDLTPSDPVRRRTSDAGGPAGRPPGGEPRAPQTPPALPVRASEDTDEAWGELPEGADDARYLREKPPHWQ